MVQIRETIIVEGRYDANVVRQCVHAHVLETNGFGIFNDKEKRALIKRLAEKNGIIILTDSDGAGLVIRNHLAGSIKSGVVKNAYVPEIFGKERRKKEASKEGLLGVEGMEKEVIINALLNAGATTEDGETKPCGGITKQDMYEDGLSGGEESAARRKALARKLSLPQNMSANALLAAMNMVLSYDEYKKAISEI